jgi:hypothetical protein
VRKKLTIFLPLGIHDSIDMMLMMMSNRLPSSTANDGLVTGTEAEKFFDLPVEPISGNWFIVASATSKNTGNAYDFQIRPAIYSKCLEI